MKSTKPANAPPLGCRSGVGLVYMDYFIILILFLLTEPFYFWPFFFLDINDFLNRINFGYIILEKCQTYFTALLFSCGAMTILKMLGLCLFHSEIPVSEVGQPFFYSTPRTFILKCGFDHYETSLHNKHKRYASYCF